MKTHDAHGAVLLVRAAGCRLIGRIILAASPHDKPDVVAIRHLPITAGLGEASRASRAITNLRTGVAPGSG